MRAQGPIHRPLDGADREVMMAATDPAVVVQFPGQPLVIVPQHDPQADLELAGIRELGEQVDGFHRGAGILNARDALGETFRGGELDGCKQVRTAILWRAITLVGGMGLSDEDLGSLAKNADWLAVLVPQDLA